jgi:Co/Zn/Cd efflux system component
MSAHCHHHAENAQPQSPAAAARYRQILWWAMGLNFAMFAVEIASGLAVSSVSLWADAIDFLGDGANYAISLVVLGAGVAVRSKAAMFKALCMLAFGVFVLGKTAWGAATANAPGTHMASVMGTVGVLALSVNLGVAAVLYKFREGDANMRSVWLCTRNDAISNIAVILAALGVFGASHVWPDLLVAALMGGLAVWSGQQVLWQAWQEMAHDEMEHTKA